MEPGFDDLLQAAQKMCRENSFMHRWKPETLAVYLRHECKCVYCQRDLMETRDIKYFFADREHILPKGKFPALESDPNNMAVACAACNTIKSDWNPNHQDPIVAPDVQHLELPEREEFLRRSRAYVAFRRAQTEEEFNKERQLITSFLEGCSAKAAGA